MGNRGLFTIHTACAAFALAAIAPVSGVLSGSPAPAQAQSFIDPNSGIELVSIGAVGNAPYRTANPNQLVNNRGSVGYVYNICKFEVTTAQWAEFFQRRIRSPGE